MKLHTFLLLVFLFFTSCFSRSSSDAEKTFEYWAGTKTPDEVELINGQYFQSPHFTIEYELFLQFKTTERWWNQYTQKNGLMLDEPQSDWKTFTELPEWFTPPDSYLIYSKNNSFDRSRYFFDVKTGTCYVYESVGM